MSVGGSGAWQNKVTSFYLLYRRITSSIRPYNVLASKAKGCGVHTLAAKSQNKITNVSSHKQSFCQNKSSYEQIFVRTNVRANKCSLAKKIDFEKVTFPTQEKKPYILGRFWKQHDQAKPENLLKKSKTKQKRQPQNNGCLFYDSKINLWLNGSLNRPTCSLFQIRLVLCPSAWSLLCIYCVFS